MRFKDGDKVVCLPGKGYKHISNSEIPHPEEGQIYTVEEDHNSQVILAELLDTVCTGVRYKWGIKRFRLATLEDLDAVSATKTSPEEEVEEYF